MSRGEKTESAQVTKVIKSAYRYVHKHPSYYPVGENEFQLYNKFESAL